MKRNIISTIKFGSGIVTFTVIEKLSTSMVEIFNSFATVAKVASFLEESFKVVEDKIGGKITKVSVVIEPTASIDSKIIPYKKELLIAGSNVTKVDIDNAISLTKNKFESEDRKVILVQPVIYKVTDVLTKSYSEAPIGKRGNKLTLTSMVTTISIQAHDYITQVVKSKGVEIQQIILSPQAISQNNLSESALNSGSILIHIGNNQSFITINKNKATLKTMSIYNYGFKNLYSGISKIFNCSKEEAKNLLVIHSNLGNTKINHVILSNKGSQDGELFTNIQLNEIVNAFISKLLMVANKFIEQNKAIPLPIVLSGHIDKIEGMLEFARLKLVNEYISVYNPVTFIEVNGQNKEALGVVNFITRLEETMGRQVDTIVETNPNLISSLKLNKKNNTKIISRFLEKIGGKNVWK